MTSPQYDPYQPPNQPDPTLPATDPASFYPPAPSDYGTPPPGYPAPQAGYPQPGYPVQPGYPPQPGYPQPGYAVAYPGYGPPPGYAVAPPTNTMAILSLVFAFVFAPLAIVFGYMARKQIAQNGEGGSGLATAGLILGYIFTSLQVLVCAFYIIVIVVVGSSGGFNN